MITFFAVLLVLGLCALAASRMTSGSPMVGILAKSAVVGVATWLIWWGLLFLHIVHIEPLVEWLGLYRLEQPWTALIFFTPPVVAATTFGLVAAMRMQQVSQNDRRPDQGAR